MRWVAQRPYPHLSVGPRTSPVECGTALKWVHLSAVPHSTGTYEEALEYKLLSIIVVRSAGAYNEAV